MTGPGSFTGAEEARSLAIEQGVINDAGGVDGRTVSFQLLDDQTSPQVAVQLATKLLGEGAAVILGPSQVGPCQAVAPLIRGKAVMYCISAGFHPEPNSSAYSSGVTTAEQLRFAVAYLRARGFVKIASIATTDANGQDTDRGIAAALARPENRNVTLVAAEHFNATDLTVAAQMARIKASGAQALINYSTGSPFGTVLHGYTDVGLDVPLVAQPAALNNTVVAQFAAYLPKEFLITGLLGDAPAIAPRGPIRNAIDAFRQAFKRAGVEPDHSMMLAWDPALIVVGAYRKLGPNATGPQINDVIRKLHGWYGVHGAYDFRGNQTGLGIDSVVMVRWDAAGKTWIPVTGAGTSTPLRSPGP